MLLWQMRWSSKNAKPKHARRKIAEKSVCSAASARFFMKNDHATMESASKTSPRIVIKKSRLFLKKYLDRFFMGLCSLVYEIL